MRKYRFVPSSVVAKLACLVTLLAVALFGLRADAASCTGCGAEHDIGPGFLGDCSMTCDVTVDQEAGDCDLAGPGCLINPCTFKFDISCSSSNCPRVCNYPPGTPGNVCGNPLSIDSGGMDVEVWCGNTLTIPFYAGTTIIEVRFKCLTCKFTLE